MKRSVRKDAYKAADSVTSVAFCLTYWLRAVVESSAPNHIDKTRKNKNHIDKARVWGDQPFNWSLCAVQLLSQEIICTLHLYTYIKQFAILAQAFYVFCLGEEYNVCSSAEPHWQVQGLILVQFGTVWCAVPGLGDTMHLSKLSWYWELGTRSVLVWEIMYWQGQGWIQRNSAFLWHRECICNPYNWAFMRENFNMVCT